MTTVKLDAASDPNEDKAIEDSLIEATYGALTSEDGYQLVINTYAGQAERLTGLNTRGSLLSRITAHARRATDLFATLPSPPSQDPIEAELALIAGAVFALSSKHHVVSANAEAARVFGVRSGGQTDLPMLTPAERQRVFALFDGPPGASVFAAVESGEPGSGRSNNPPMVHAYAVKQAGMNGRVVIIRSLEAELPVEVGQHLRDAFGLTPSELAVVRLFVQAPDTEHLAALRGVKPATVRAQLKAIFAKTQTGSQAELLQRLMLISQAHQPAQAALNERPWADPLDRETVFETPQGRRIAYSWMGAPPSQDAHFVLLSHGPLTGYMLAPQTQTRLREAGICAVAPCRPGFGHTDPDLSCGQLEASARCFDAVLDHLRMRGLVDGPVAGVGLVSGLVPLVYHAARQPGRYKGLLGAGGCIPFGDLREKRDLSSGSRILLSLNKNAPILAQLALKGALRQVQIHGPSWMVEKIYGVGDTDIRTIRDFSTLAFLTASARMLTVHGTQTFERELPLIVYDWEADFRRSGLRLKALQGNDDPVFPPSMANAFDRRNDRYDLKECQAAGQLLYLQKPDETARAIIDLVQN